MELSKSDEATAALESPLPQKNINISVPIPIIPLARHQGHYPRISSS